MGNTAPRTIAEYLEQLRAALGDADPALIQDALYDAEEHLRSELHDNPGKSEAEMLAKIVGSYGAPEEVATLYVDRETRARQTSRPPPRPPRRTALGRFFAVGGDSRAYAALLYMLLSLATGVFYFVWTVVGVTLSLSLSPLAFGILLALLFLGATRALALVEGRMVEAMLGERMPRRPVYVSHETRKGARIKAIFTDARTWTTLLYFVLLLPLGIFYFTLAVTGIALSLSFILAPLVHVGWMFGVVRADWAGQVHFNDALTLPWWIDDPLLFALGIALGFGLLHLARGIARFQGGLAKTLLVHRGGD